MSDADGVGSLVRRFFEAIERGDSDALTALVTEREPVLGVGTDGVEWWDDRGRLIAVMAAQAQEMAGVKVEVGPIIAAESGDLGWAACQPTFRFPDGNGFGGRLTVVGARTDGEWKFAHFHLSVGVPNEDLIGRGLTT